MAEDGISQLEGTIKIQTQFKEAINSLNKFAKDTNSTLQKIEKSVSGLKSSLDSIAGNYKKLGDSARRSGNSSAEAAKKASAAESKRQNLLSKAVNKVANFEQAVKKSNISQKEQAEVLSRARRGLQQYQESLNRGGVGAKNLDNANTKLATTLGAANRALTESKKAARESQAGLVSATKATSQLQISAERTSNAIRASGLQTSRQDQLIKQLNSSLINARNAIKRFGTGSVEAARAQTKFRETSARANIEVKNFNRELRKKEVQNWRNQMRNLTSSVQLALGPLSGVASRIAALSSLFTRNVAPLAGLVAGITGLTVAFGKSFNAGRLAEQQMLQLEGVVNSLGEKAKFTADELFDLGTETGRAFLTSAGQAREAAAALATFGSVGRSQFEGILSAAQGMSQLVGGSLKSNVVRIGRLLEDPEENFSALRRQGISFTEEQEDQIRVLRAQGKVFQANEVIMKEFTSFQEAAKDAAGGLSGAIDTAGENLNLFFEELFKSGDATGEATDGISRLATTLREFSESEAAKNIGTLFKNVINVTAGAVNLLLENLRTLAVIGIGAAVAGFTKLTLTLLTNTGILKVNDAGVIKSIALREAWAKANFRTAFSLRAVGTAMKSIPFISLAAGVASVAAAFFAMRGDAEDAEEAVSNTGNTIQQQIRDIGNLTEGQRGGLLTSSEELAQDERNIKRAIKKAEEDLKNARETIRDAAADGGLSLDARESSKEVRDAARTVENFSQTLSALKGRLDLVNDLQSSLVDSGKGLANNNDELSTSYESISKNVQELRNEFLREDVQLENLNDKIETATIQRNSLTAAADAGNQQAKEDINTLNRLLAAMREQRAELKSSGEETNKLSRSFFNLKDALKEAESELLVLKKNLPEDELEKFKRQVELDSELDSLNDKLGRLSDEGYRNLSVAIGRNINESFTEEQRQKAVTQAFLAKFRAVRQETFAQEDLAAARDKANEAINAGKTQPQRQQEGLQEQRTAAISLVFSGNEGDKQTGVAALKSIAEQEQKILRDRNTRLKELSQLNPLTEVEQLQADFDRRRQAILDNFDTEEQDVKDHLAELDRQFKQQKSITQFAQTAQSAQRVVGKAMEAMTAAGRENAKEFQILAIGQALISQALAVAAVFDKPGAGFFEKAATAALAGATVGAQIAQIKAQSFAEGGSVRGRGTGTSDSIPANLSNGEFVVNSRAVERFGLRNLERINSGNTPSFAQGGSVTPVPVNSGGGGGSNSPVIVNVNFEGGVSADVEQRESVGENGERQLDVLVTNVVKRGFSNGTFDSDLARFGASRQGRRR